MPLLTENQIDVLAGITACIDLGLTLEAKDGMLTFKRFSVPAMKLEDVTYRNLKDSFYRAFGDAEEIQGGYEDTSSDWIDIFKGKKSEELTYISIDVEEVVKHVK